MAQGLTRTMHLRLLWYVATACARLQYFWITTAASS